jgi:hypothetical protein
MHHLSRAVVFACCLTFVEAVGLGISRLSGDSKTSLSGLTLMIVAGFLTAVVVVAVASFAATSLGGPEYVVRTHTICPGCRRKIFIAATVCPQCEEGLEVDRHARPTYLYVTLAGGAMALVSWWVGRIVG